MSSRQDVFVDFEIASPTPEESELYDDAQEILDHSQDILRDLSGYKGATKEIREAITKTTPESEIEAWQALVPLVIKLKSFYDFSKKLECLVSRLLNQICGHQPDDLSMTVAEMLDYHQALVKQFAKLLEFVLKFDEYKMMYPSLQNDFSYFRRTIQRLKNHAPSSGRGQSADYIEKSYEEIESQIPISVANSMSLFFAQATPMLTAMTDATTKLVQDSGDNALANSTTETLSVMAKVCQRMLGTPELKSRIRREETELFILRVMVAIVILYDHVHPTGAFAKGSMVDIKGCIKVLKEHKGGSKGLLDALRYTTKHLNDENTPKSTKALVFENLG